jgi:type 1 glutamine amidotransferase
MPTVGNSRADIALVVGGRWHDMGFARAELLSRLVSHDCAFVSIHEDFSDTATLGRADAVVAYTCDVRPSADEVVALRAMIEAGGRFLALHATNSAIDEPQPGGDRVFTTPAAMPAFHELLGSRFLAHPPIAEFLVEAVRPEDPLVRGIGSFATTDEVYYARTSADLQVILDAEIAGPCPGFAEQPPQGQTLRSSVLYRRTIGAGQVVYFTLGHCRGRFDLVDLGVTDLQWVDRRAWESPAFRTILDRCIAWAVYDWVDSQQHSAHLTEENT